MRKDMRQGLLDLELRKETWRTDVRYGPWTHEPDWTVWVHEGSGYTCSTFRNRAGAWCGYVWTGDDHPIHIPANMDDEWARDLTSHNPVYLSVHGGVTYHGRLEQPECGLDGIAVGFDCGHSYDVSPTDNYSGRSEEYRDLGYVVDQTEYLAEQILNFAPLHQLVRSSR